MIVSVNVKKQKMRRHFYSDAYSKNFHLYLIYNFYKMENILPYAFSSKIIIIAYNL